MLVSGKQEKAIFMQAREEHWAIGAFNCGDMVTFEAVLQAAEALGVPVAIQTFDSFDPEAPEAERRVTEFEAKVLNKLFLTRAEMSPVPVIIHLDHCRTYQGCMRGIQNGCASVMLDASQQPYADNVALVKKVVEAAHACGVLVEGEIGHVGGHPDSAGVIYTEVQDAVNFVNDTNVDLCAVSVGTVHGVYRSEPSLNYERIAELREAVPVPLVLHGASGLSDEQYKNSIKAGISKVNFATYISLAGGKAIVEAVKAAGDTDTPRMGGFVMAGQNAARDFLIHHMEVFGTKKVAL